MRLKEMIATRCISTVIQWVYRRRCSFIVTPGAIDDEWYFERMTLAAKAVNFGWRSGGNFGSDAGVFAEDLVREVSAEIHVNEFAA